jgi:hypothetical protein
VAGGKQQLNHKRHSVNANDLRAAASFARRGRSIFYVNVSVLCLTDRDLTICLVLYVSARHPKDTPIAAMHQSVHDTEEGDDCIVAKMEDC